MNLGAFPYQQFIRVSQPLESKIKSDLVRAGVPSMIAAVILGIVVLFLDGDLVVAKLFLGIGALNLLFAGAFLPAGRQSVSSGYLNLTIAAQARRPVLALSIMEAVLMAIAYLALIFHAIESTEVSTLSLVIAMLVPVVIVVLVVMNYRVVRRLLPPRPEILHKYGLSGQVVGPPTHYGPPPGPPQAGGRRLKAN